LLPEDRKVQRRSGAAPRLWDFHGILTEFRW
jgi:hypothetical protein